MVRTKARLAAALTGLLAAFAVVVVPQAPVAYADAAGQGGDYQPISPARKVLDTRNGTGGVTGPRPAGITSFQVLGAAGIPATGVSAVMVRVTAIAPTVDTFLTVFTEGTTRASVATVNLMKGESLSNFAIAKPSASGKLSVFNAASSTHIQIEVQGYFTVNTGSAVGGMIPVPHTRVVDTRDGTGTTAGAIPAKGSRKINLIAGGVPAGAYAFFGSVTVPPTTAPGYFSTSTGTVLDYENGINSSSGASIVLQSDGTATFTNQGTAPAHLIIDTHAYSTRTTTAGSGYRHVHNRLFGLGTVAANATVDVSVAGTNGLPIKGVAGAMLSFQAGGTAVGTIRAWPAGEAEPARVTETQFAANTSHRSSAIVKPGVDGKIRVRNISAAATNLFVDIEGWFAEPLTVIPPVQHSPVTVVQAPAIDAQLGTLDYAYVNNVGQVVVGHQDNLDNAGTIQYKVISGQEQFTGQPSLNALPNKALQLSAQYGPGGEVWTNAQSAPRSTDWPAWKDLGGTLAAPPTAVTLSNGTSVQFAIDSDGKLLAYAQTGTYPAWRNLGDQDLTGSPTVVTVRDGVQVFGRDSAGGIRMLTYRVDGTVTPWVNLGGTGAGAPSVVVYPGYVMRVFAQAADGTIVTKKQDPVTGAFPAAWDQVGPDVFAGAPAAILDPQSGRTSVVARAADNLIYLSTETTAGSGVFGNWTAVNDPSRGAASDPTVAQVDKGSDLTWIIVFRSINSTVFVYGEPDSSGAFTAPHALPPPI